MTTESAPAPKKSKKTTPIILLSILGVVVLCTVLNVMGRNATGGTALAPTPLSTLDMTPVIARVATVFVNMFGDDIATNSGEVQILKCAQYTGRKLLLPTGESAFIPCPAHWIRALPSCPAWMWRSRPPSSAGASSSRFTSSLRQATPSTG